jgi:DNA-binding NtrC family response regulator
MPTSHIGGIAMRRLVFIDDDKTELDDFGRIVEGEYDYVRIHWPLDAEKLFSGTPPDIFVSDLYLPPQDGDKVPTAVQRESAASAATQVGARFSHLYADPTGDDKARLKETMRIISAALEMLALQWTALGQHPDHGIELLTRLNSVHPTVPLVFYSRKITPKDVIRVLQSGAVDAIQKGALKNEEVLVRLARAYEIWHREDLRNLRAHRFNTNVTIVPLT